MDEGVTLDDSYDEFPRVEERFRSRLDESLNPRGPDSLWTDFERLVPRRGDTAVDVGCGEGDDCIELARRYGLRVRGVDPVERHLELSRRAADSAGLGSLVSFAWGTAEHLPLPDRSVDVVWAKECLMYADLDASFSEFRRVLAADGTVFVFQVFTGPRMTDAEAVSFWRDAADANSVRPADLERAAATAGFAIVASIEYGSEWGEYAQEQTGAGGRRLVHAARLLREPQRYIDEFGPTNYRIMLGDCLWHVYRMIGNLHGAAYAFTSVH